MSSLLEFRFGGNEEGRRLVDDQRNNLLGEKEQRFQGSVGTQGRGEGVCVYVYVCESPPGRNPRFLRNKSTGREYRWKPRSYRIYELALKHTCIYIYIINKRYYV